MFGSNKWCLDTHRRPKSKQYFKLFSRFLNQVSVVSQTSLPLADWRHISKLPDLITVDLITVY